MSMNSPAKGDLPKGSQVKNGKPYPLPAIKKASAARRADNIAEMIKEIIVPSAGLRAFQQLSGDLAAVERIYRQEIEERPPEIDTHQDVIGEFYVTGLIVHPG